MLAPTLTAFAAPREGAGLLRSGRAEAGMLAPTPGMFFATRGGVGLLRCGQGGLEC